jgi:hypothetical protein
MFEIGYTCVCAKEFLYNTSNTMKKYSSHISIFDSLKNTIQHQTINSIQKKSDKRLNIEITYKVMDFFSSNLKFCTVYNMWDSCPKLVSAHFIM